MDSADAIAVTAVVVATDTDPIPTKVQIVNRKSSEELLRKFADPDEEKRPEKPRKRIKNSGEREEAVVEASESMVERKRLIAPMAKRRSLLLRQLAKGRSHLKNKSLVRTLGKTWRRTVDGASRVFIEKHYNKHRRLISDVV